MDIEQTLTEVYFDEIEREQFIYNPERYDEIREQQQNETKELNFD